MELQQLRYFILAAETQNLSLAAKQLGISQPSLSRSITRLENDLGVKLFSRSGKKITLNERGKTFLAGVRDSLALLDTAAEESSAQPGTLTGRLRLGLFWPDERIYSCIAAFSRLYPGVSFWVDSQPENPAHISTDVYDMLLYPTDTLFLKYRGEVIARERLYLALPAGHPLARSGPLSPHALRNEPFVFLHYGNGAPAYPYELCLRHGLHPNIRLLADNAETQQRLIAAGMALGFVPEHRRVACAADPPVALAELTGDWMQPVLLGFRREKHLSETARAFQQQVAEQFSQTVV